MRSPVYPPRRATLRRRRSGATSIRAARQSSSELSAATTHARSTQPHGYEQSTARCCCLVTDAEAGRATIARRLTILAGRPQRAPRSCRGRRPVQARPSRKPCSWWLVCWRTRCPRCGGGQIRSNALLSGRSRRFRAWRSQLHERQATRLSRQERERQ